MSLIFCKCGCGKQREEFDNRGRRREYIVGHYARGKHPSEETLKKIRIPNTIEQNNNISAGKLGKPLKNPEDRITPLNRLIRRLREYKEWRLMVFGRDNFTCQSCGIRGCYLEPHHIIMFSQIRKENNITSIEEARRCSALWDIANGITYCIPCHKLLENKGGFLPLIKI